MNWTAEIITLTPDSVIQYQILQGNTPLTFHEVFRLWERDASFRSFYNELLAISSFPAYYWEHPALTKNHLQREYTFVLVNSSALALILPDAAPFSEQFEQGTKTVRFSNLRADAELVAPSPQGKDLSAFTHLANFVRRANPDQQQAFWQLIGKAAQELIQEQACWLSTSGLGVHWLHVRFDTRPKYYTHRPFAIAP